MAKLKELEPKVERILEKNPKTRGDNFILYVEVLEDYVDTGFSFRSICLAHKQLGIPSLESITRARRKIQERRPELRDEEAAEIRKSEEAEYIQYGLDLDGEI